MDHVTAQALGGWDGWMFKPSQIRKDAQLYNSRVFPSAPTIISNESYPNSSNQLLIQNLTIIRLPVQLSKPQFDCIINS